MPNAYAYLNSNNGDAGRLPRQFTYSLPVPTIRNKVFKTASGIRIHSAPSAVAGDSVIDWKCVACERDAKVDILGNIVLGYYQIRAFREGDGSAGYPFWGYWGDVFQVRFLDLKVDKSYAAGLFDLSGMLQIVSVTSWGTQS